MKIQQLPQIINEVTSVTLLSDPERENQMKTGLWKLKENNYIIYEGMMQTLLQFPEAKKPHSSSQVDKTSQ